MVVAVIMVVVMIMVMMVFVVMIMFVVMMMVVVVLPQFLFHFLKFRLVAGAASAMVTHGDSPLFNR